MTEQNFSNHRRYVPGFHIVLSVLLIGGSIISIINVIRHPANSGGHVSSVLVALLFVWGFLISWYVRQFPIKAQDRAIRTEEGLRFFILTGKALDNRLTIGQIAALRFASDDELVTLSARAITESLSPYDIKKSIKNWRADHHRV
jgi:hypothetical protein